MRTGEGGSEVQFPDMTKKVIAFPEGASILPRSVAGPQNRIILKLGKQRIALDIACQATLLNPVPAPLVVAAQANGPGGKIRQPKP